MKKDDRLDQLEEVFKALADQTRLRILGLLGAGEICVCDIHSSLGLPQPTVSRHLAYLRKSGLVEWRKEGLWVHYRLATLNEPAIQAVVDSVEHALGHLKGPLHDRRRLATRVDLSPPSPRKRVSCCG